MKLKFIPVLIQFLLPALVPVFVGGQTLFDHLIAKNESLEVTTPVLKEGQGVRCQADVSLSLFDLLVKCRQPRGELKFGPKAPSVDLLPVDVQRRWSKMTDLLGNICFNF
jgi:hypothetical protein